MSRSVGIVGGLGPETTSEFYINLIKRSRKYCKYYPKITIDNVSFPFYLEKEIIQKSKNEDKILPFLVESIERLNKTKVDFIIIPCNTVHLFIKKLREKSSAPILSIIEETVNYIKTKNYKAVGILATTKTIENKLYEKPLRKNKIKVILPTKNEQEEISQIILLILENKIEKMDKVRLEKIIKKLIERGSGAIVLGCSDLQLILRNNLGVEIVDSMEILAESTFRYMVENENLKHKNRIYR